MKRAIYLLATLTAFTAFSSQAQSTDEEMDKNGVYVGGNYGYLRVDGDDEFDDDKDVWQGVIGYRFNQYFALEGGYIDFGDYGNDLANASTDGYTAAIKGMIPIADRIALYGKLGQIWSETEYQAGTIMSEDDDDSLFVGGGISFAVTSNLLINAEYVVYDTELNAEQAADDIDDVNFETDLKQASLGVEYRF